MDEPPMTESPGVAAQSDNRSTLAVIGMVLGIISVPGALFPICAIVLAIPALILSVLGMSSEKRSLAIVGVITAALGLLLGLAHAVVTVILVMSGTI
jgi:hypothetical protein